MQEQITNLKAIIAALDTLSLTGSKNCGTFYNCMTVLAKTVNELEMLDCPNHTTESDIPITVIEEDTDPAK